MKIFRERKHLVAVAALVFVFAGCKGDSPTAPTNTTGGPVTPPSGSTVTLTVSNATPLVDSTSVITATVTSGGSPVPNGTAVEFTTTLGTFTEANASTTIRTTTNGVATTTLASSTAGTATVTATVTNVSKTATVTFTTKPVTPQPPDLAPAITSISPTTGKPQGGDEVTLTGKNFRTPLRVLFDFGDNQPKEAFVSSSTSTQIKVITPSVDLGSGQTKEATITLINEAGTANEARVSATTKFTFQSTVLTPKILTVSPTSGPIDGGTKVTIFGEGFQAPVQVFFGSAEVQVLNVTFSQIQIVAPKASDTAAGGSGAVTGFVDLRVININSGTTGTLASAFRYVAKALITTFGPGEGLFTGGTQVVIDGAGFNAPVAVTIGGTAALVTNVTPTRITAITSGIVPTGCTDVTGAVVVTNTDNGDGATSATAFIYRVPKPAVVGVSSGSVAGGSITITVLNAYGTPRLALGDTGLIINSSTDNGNGSFTFNATIPSTIKLDTQACAGAPGTFGPIATAFDVKYTSVTTSCTDSLPKAAVVNPPSVPVATLSPSTFATFLAKFTSATIIANPTPPPATIVSVPASFTASQPQSMLLVDTGAGALTVSSATTTCSATNWSISLPASGTSLNECDSVPVIATYKPAQPPAASTTNPNTTADVCTVTLSTNAGTKTINLIGQVQ